MSEIENPSSTLATGVVDGLIENGLLRADKRDALVAQIASGKMKGEDWRIGIELAIAKGGAE